VYCIVLCVLYSVVCITLIFRIIHLRLKIYSGNISADLIGGKSIDLSTRCSSAVSTSSPIKSIDNVVVSGGGDSQRFLTHFSLSSLNLSTDCKCYILQYVEV